MGDQFDFYIGRCLKNWTAKNNPPLNRKAALLDAADRYRHQEESSFTRFFLAFANRWSSSGEHYYHQRHWQAVGPLTQTNRWTLILATNHWLAN